MGSRRTVALVVVGVVVLAAVFAAVLLRPSDNTAVPSAPPTTVAHEPNTAVTAPDPEPVASPEETRQAQALELDAVTQSARRPFDAVYAYEMVAVEGEPPFEGQVRVSHNPEFISVELLEGSSGAMWRDVATGSLWWCTDTACEAPGAELNEPGSEGWITGNLLVNLAPALLAPHIERRDPEVMSLFLTEREAGELDVGCAKLVPPGGTGDFFERCWTGDGLVALIDNGFQSAVLVDVVPSSGPPGLPHTPVPPPPLDLDLDSPPPVR